jgi:hypothetical protein
MISLITFLGLNAFFAKFSYDYGHMRIAMVSTFSTVMLLAASVVVGVNP